MTSPEPEQKRIDDISAILDERRQVETMYDGIAYRLSKALNGEGYAFILTKGKPNGVSCEPNHLGTLFSRPELFVELDQNLGIQRVEALENLINGRVQPDDAIIQAIVDKMIYETAVW